jgi:hypothetical protein
MSSNEISIIICKRMNSFVKKLMQPQTGKLIFKTICGHGIINDLFVTENVGQIDNKEKQTRLIA